MEPALQRWSGPLRGFALPGRLRPSCPASWPWALSSHGARRQWKVLGHVSCARRATGLPRPSFPRPSEAVLSIAGVGVQMRRKLAYGGERHFVLDRPDIDDIVIHERIALDRCHVYLSILVRTQRVHAERKVVILFRDLDLGVDLLTRVYLGMRKALIDNDVGAGSLEPSSSGGVLQQL